MSTSTDRRASRTAARITSTATNSAAIASAFGSPARTTINPISTATEPARSDAKCNAFDASAGDSNRRAARELPTARVASITITTTITAATTRSRLATRRPNRTAAAATRTR